MGLLDPLRTSLRYVTLSLFDPIYLLEVRRILSIQFYGFSYCIAIVRLTPTCRFSLIRQ